MHAHYEDISKNGLREGALGPPHGFPLKLSCQVSFTICYEMRPLRTKPQECNLTPKCLNTRQNIKDEQAWAHEVVLTASTEL